MSAPDLALNVTLPTDDIEREAEATAETILRQAELISAGPAEAGGPAAGGGVGSGRPLPRDVRAYFEPRFGFDFSTVRVHTDPAAAGAAQALQARAFTAGRDIVFAAGAYTPGTPEGKRLLSHELAHVVQQRRQPVPGLYMRKRAQPPVRQATVAEAAEFLEEMAAFLERQREFALTIMQPTPPGAVTADMRARAHRVLNQQRLQEMLTNAHTVFEVQAPALQTGSTDGTRLRTALLAVIRQIREAAAAALTISDALPAPAPDEERNRYASLVAEMIETDPFTSAGLTGTPAFGAAETAAGTSHQAFIEAYLDDLIRALPGQTLDPAARDAILQRISAGLRRAFVTVEAGPAGTIDVRRISNPAIVDKYHRVVELLSAAITTRPAQLNIITDAPPVYTLPPDPVPDVTAQLTALTSIGAVDFSRVPVSELPYVRNGVLNAASTVFPATSTIQFRNASWPVVFHVRRGGNTVDVRYDLIFDANKNVRVERLGDATPREVAPAFAQLTVDEKKAQLVADFGLAAVDDRPAAGTRAIASWTAAELDQVKAAYDLIPVRDRPALRGVTLVRDHQGPAGSVAGQVLMGFAHTDASAAHDQPGPAAHDPPHIHYYDAAFDQNAVTAVGAPGSSGPGADWTIAHEVGHMRIFLAVRDANDAVRAANAQITAANAGLPALNAALPQAQHQLRQAYGQARTAANQAIQALNAALIATPPATPAQRTVLLQAAQAAVTARDQARTALAAGGVPAAMVQAATAMDAALDALLTATQSIGAAQDQIPTFIALAGTFGFTPFTDYARSGGNDEFFAEAYALYLTDPDRLSAMNRSIFLWFEAGMPMDPAWRPPP
jgi:hypothetical protein